jgi:hypothetical protein
LPWLISRRPFADIVTSSWAWLSPPMLLARREIGYAENPSVQPSGKPNEINGRR